MVFDGDAAGQRAAAKAIPLFVDAGILGGRIARLPAGVDPDDFVRQPDNGADAFRRLVEGARPMLDQFIQDVASDANVPDRVTALRTIAALLVKVKDQTTREIYAGQLAGILRMEPQQVRRAMQEAAAATQRQARPQDRRRPRRPADRRAAGARAGSRRAPPGRGAGAAGRPGQLPRAARGRPRPRARATCWSTRWRASCTGPPPSRRPRPATLDIPAWLDTAAPGRSRHDRGGPEGRKVRQLADPAGYLRKLVIRLEILRVDAEIAMNTRLQKEAQARGDEDASNAHSRRGVELRQTKEGLKAALQRP